MRRFIDTRIVPGARTLCVLLAFYFFLSPARAQVVINWNNLTNWVQTSAPAQNWNSIASSADGSKLVAVVYSGGGIYTSTNSGTTWAQQTNALSENWALVASSADGNKLVAVTWGGGIYTSTNAGIMWVEQPS